MHAVLDVLYMLSPYFLPLALRQQIPYPTVFLTQKKGSSRPRRNLSPGRRLFIAASIASCLFRPRWIGDATGAAALEREKGRPSPLPRLGPSTFARGPSRVEIKCPFSHTYVPT